jgi:hypothetical protein
VYAGVTREEIKTWVESNLDKKMQEFALGWWRISIQYNRLDAGDGVMAPFMQVSSYPEREKSVLEIDLERCEELEEEQFVSFLEHELLHVIHAPFYLLWNQVLEVAPQSSQTILQTAFLQNCEMTVRHLERLVHALRNSSTEDQKGSP